jgi:hypothetical protein
LAAHLHFGAQVRGPIPEHRNRAKQGASHQKHGRQHQLFILCKLMGRLQQAKPKCKGSQNQNGPGHAAILGRHGVAPHIVRQVFWFALGHRRALSSQREICAH